MLLEIVTTPVGSILIGIILTLLITGFVWWDSREKKFTLITLVAGLVITIGGVIVLYMNGSYS